MNERELLRECRDTLTRIADYSDHTGAERALRQVKEMAGAMAGVVNAALAGPEHAAQADDPRLPSVSPQAPTGEGPMAWAVFSKEGSEFDYMVYANKDEAYREIVDRADCPEIIPLYRATTGPTAEGADWLNTKQCASCVAARQAFSHCDYSLCPWRVSVQGVEEIAQSLIHEIIELEKAPTSPGLLRIAQQLRHAVKLLSAAPRPDAGEGNR